MKWHTRIQVHLFFSNCNTGHFSEILLRNIKYIKHVLFPEETLLSNNYAFP